MTTADDSAAAEQFLAGGNELGQRMRALPWQGTPLGPPHAWPRSLKTAVRIMLTSRQPFWIGWGEELTFLYNDAYRSIIGGRHPWALGRPTRTVWSEIWPDIAPMLSTAMSGSEGTYVEEQLLIMERNGYPEETYYTFSYSPIPDDDGSPGGIICANSDDTRRVIDERQLALLGRLAAQTRDARTWQEACRVGTRALCSNAHDILFALLYLAEPERGGLALAAQAGLPEGHAAAPSRLATGQPPWATSGLPRPGTIEPAVDLAGLGGSFGAGALGRPPLQAALVPLPAHGESGRSGLLVVGLNPLRLLDEGYRGFLAFAADQLAAAIASASAYEEERQRAEVLAELDRAKTRFFSNVSHEFRTPLTLMLGPLEHVLERPDLQAELHDELEVVHRNGLRLLKLVNSLLDFSRVEAGRVQARFQPTDLAALTVELASSFRSLCERAGLTLRIDCSPAAEPVFVDRDMWEKIVLNLLSNAFKFTFEGEIAVALRPAGGRALLTVADSGVGIPEAEQPKVFERFHRVEGTRGRTYEGSGIGLALVRELVALHGGTIAVESREGGGSRFTVSLPLGSAHLPDSQVERRPPPDPATASTGAAAFLEEALRWLPAPEANGPGEGARQDGGEGAGLGAGRNAGQDVAPAAAPPRQAGGSPGTGLQQGRRPRLLLADDNADMRDYVRRLLGADYEVEAVVDGLAALASARRLAPDLVVADVMMPRLDGLSLIQELRDDPLTREIPVILLSARAGEEAKVEGLRAGADDYLVKPFAAREVTARVEAQLNMLAIRREAEAALRESEARFRNMADNAPVMVWVTERDGSCSFLSRSWYEHTGQAPAEALGFGWTEATHPEERAAAHEIFRAASARREAFRLEYRLRRRDGSYGWAIDAARPRFAPDGQFLGYIGSVIDIDERRRAEEHRKLLVDELNHRVKNTLAIVQGLAHQTFRSAGLPREPLRTFEGRLGALSAAHALLTRSNWEMATLGELAAGATRNVLGDDAGRVGIEGPTVVLQPKQAVSFTMALHELCTNALKYGALSGAQGRVAIGWTLAADPTGTAGRLAFTWRESGGPPVATPARRGFGMRLIEQALAQELEGEVEVAFARDGLVCRIEAPLTAAATA